MITKQPKDAMFTMLHERGSDGRWRITRNVVVAGTDMRDETKQWELRGQEWFGQDLRWSRDPGTGWDSSQDAYACWLASRDGVNPRFAMESFSSDGEPDGEPIRNATGVKVSTKTGASSLYIGWDHELNLEVGESTWRVLWVSGTLCKITRTA